MNSETNPPAASVILIHGLWMRGVVMCAHERRLRREGFTTRCFSYPSWTAGLAENVERLAQTIAATPGATIHLVAHSLGGALVLSLLAQRPEPRIGRVVLLGTPVAGCHCGFFCAAHPPLSRLVGRTFRDWFGAPRPAPPPGVEIGTIAGTRRISWGRFIPGLERPNDGLIAVSETRIATAADSVALCVSHTGLLLSRACSRQVASFLTSGKFVHD